MEDKIKELIEFHKLARQECGELLSDLSRNSNDIVTDLLIRQYQEERAWRGIFINQLEDLL